MAAIKIGVAAWHDIATYYPPGHRSSSERFDYYYSQEEMEDWAPRIAMMKRNAEEVHVIIRCSSSGEYYRLSLHDENRLLRVIPT